MRRHQSPMSWHVVIIIVVGFANLGYLCYISTNYLDRTSPKIVERLINQSNATEVATTRETESSKMWERDRDNFFGNFVLPYQNRCRFGNIDPKSPQFYQLNLPGRKRVNTTRRLDGKIAEAENSTEEIMEKSWTHLDVKDRMNSNATNERDICYIHVGKTGGSSVDCNLRLGQKNIHCFRKGFKDHPESAISRLTTCRVHMYRNQFDKGRNETYQFSYLVSVRNPITRLSSWYIYENFKNLPQTFRGEYNHKKPFPCGSIMIHSCYMDLNLLASVGLEGPRPPLPLKYLVGNNLTEEECKSWAWGAVQGGAAAMYHNLFNYGFYMNSFLPDKSNEIFVLRNEKLWDDWEKLNRFLGGTGKPPLGTDLRVNSYPLHKLKVNNRTISSRGMSNLCRALCDEIQIYKRLLFRAANLSPEEKEESMDDLQLYCPEETSIMPRQCTY